MAVDGEVELSEERLWDGRSCWKDATGYLQVMLVELWTVRSGKALEGMLQRLAVLGFG